MRICRLLFLLSAISLAAGASRAQTWMRVPEIPAVYVNVVASERERLYAVTDSAIFASADAGMTWAPTAAQPPSGEMQTLFPHHGALYVGTRGDGVFRSLDSGRTWEALNAGLSGNARRVIEFALQGDSLFAGTDAEGIYVLNLLHPPIWTPHNLGLFQYGTSSIVAGEHTLVAAIGMYVFTHPRGAAQWTDVVVDSFANHSPIRLFLLDTSIYLGTTGGVFKGNARGTAWKKADISQFPGKDIVAFASHHSRLFAALSYRSQHWIFSTDNGGQTWEIRAHEFADILSMHVAQGRLWAGRTDGLWWYDMSVWTSAESQRADIPRDFKLHQNYPNPWNPSTRVEYTVAGTRDPGLEARWVTVRVYDILGREVAVLVDEMKRPGTYAVSFDGKGLASGFYVYRLTAGTVTLSRTMLLLR
jgi:photosystem II stability/assembly factor-like uncharacterized protein